MRLVETKHLDVLCAFGKVNFEVDILDEEDFEDGETVEVEFPDGTLVRSEVTNKCHEPTIYDPFDPAFRQAYISYSPNGISVEVRIAGLKARRV